jgi:hypothetical protein
MEQLDILRHAVEALERMKVPYIVVGSIASIAYGESRFTQDIDIIAAFEMKHVDGLAVDCEECQSTDLRGQSPMQVSRSQT